VLVEIPLDYHTEPKQEVFIHGDKNYEGLTDTKGIDISTRTKHREYMKQNNLALAGDYTNEWKAAEKQRQANKDPTRVHDLVRAYEQTQRRRR
jgi:hypothetical protein